MMKSRLSVRNELPLSGASSLFEKIYSAAPCLVHRAPSKSDTTRWLHQSIDEVNYRFAQPITFTPYASARPCSARCHFCSETLRPQHGGTSAASLRPQQDYFDGLCRALAVLGSLPISFSLSGLEASDDKRWFLNLLQALRQAEKDGLQVQERVLYSNGAGFSRDQANELVSALENFELSWLELSRHHYGEAENQAIMRFRAEEFIASNTAFENTAKNIAKNLPLKMVCIIQRGGIDDAGQLEKYLAWAISCGAISVIFRELSRFDDYYRSTRSRDYIDSHRVKLETLLQACWAQPHWQQCMQATQITEGYYFWNVKFQHISGVEVVFESSDYTAMHEQHNTGDIYKLVYFANGHLCAGWEPDRNILWRYSNG
jgi:hypothetical protein